MIAIIDYGGGNLRSVEKALTAIGEESIVTRDRHEILNADKVILPGVGAFGDAMNSLKKYELDKVIHQVTAENKPFLGICLGLQLLFEESEESPGVKGLGILKGKILRIPEHEDLKIPHMGWNSLDVVRPGRLLHGIEPGAEFYFVHSYYVEPAPELVMATTVYGKEFCSVYGRDGLWAVQCHLEKSGRPGLTVLRNFYDYCDEVRHA